MLENGRKHIKILKYLNVFCLITGMLAAFGACIVANFQETSNIQMHLIGANLCFGVGSAYFIIQVSSAAVTSNYFINKILFDFLIVAYIFIQNLYCAKCDTDHSSVFKKIALDRFSNNLKLR